MTLRSIVQGVFWAVVFSAAATYIALKLGQGIESAIPISILAVGFSVLAQRFAKSGRPSTLIENVNVLAIGATSGIVAGGSVFTMPAIYILGLEGRSSLFQIFIVPLLGAFLGVFFLAPFRRYFVRDLHGQLPYPEAPATTEILMAGKRGGHSALVLSAGSDRSGRLAAIDPGPSDGGEDSMTTWVGFLPMAVLAAGGVVLAKAHGQEEMPLQRPLAEVRDTILGLPGQDVTISPEEQRVAGMDSYLMRYYVRPDSTLGFSLYVGYYESQSQGRTIHSPKNCLPGAGWEPVSAGTATVVAEGASLTVNRYLLKTRASGWWCTTGTRAEGGWRGTSTQ